MRVSSNTRTLLSLLLSKSLILMQRKIWLEWLHQLVDWLPKLQSLLSTLRSILSRIEGEPRTKYSLQRVSQLQTEFSTITEPLNLMPLMLQRPWCRVDKTEWLSQRPIMLGICLLWTIQSERKSKITSQRSRWIESGMQCAHTMTTRSFRSSALISMRWTRTEA